MRIEAASEPGTPGRSNEDFVSVALPSSGEGGVLVLLDGVTPPAGDTGCIHDVPWYTTRLGGSLLELSASRRDMSLGECLAEAIGRTAGTHRKNCDLSHPRTPQATVVVARWDEERVEHLVLSDSVLLLESPDKGVRVVLDDRLDRLPEPVPALLDRLRSAPRGSSERTAAAAGYAHAVEGLRNAEGGFFTAAADPAVTAAAVCGVTPRQEVRALAAVTDGVGRLVDMFGDRDWPELFALLREHGPEAVISRVRDHEAGDPHGVRHPRWKTSDDATAVLAVLRDAPR